MSSTNYVYSENGFKSEDSQVLGKIPEFGKLSGHMKRVIMESFSPLSLIALVEAELRLESDLEEGVLKVTMWCEGDMDSVTFPNETGYFYEDLEMYRKAFTFVLRICSALNTVNASIIIDPARAGIPCDFYLLRIPSIERILTVRLFITPSDAPVDFNTQISTHDANEVCYDFPRGDPDEAMHRFVQNSLSSPRI